jgi:hypothetical protein
MWIAGRGQRWREQRDGSQRWRWNGRRRNRACLPTVAAFTCRSPLTAPPGSTGSCSMVDREKWASGPFPCSGFRTLVRRPWMLAGSVMQVWTLSKPGTPCALRGGSLRRRRSRSGSALRATSRRIALGGGIRNMLASGRQHWRHMRIRSSAPCPFNLSIPDSS